MPRPRKPQPRNLNGGGSITTHADGWIVVRVTLPDGRCLSRYANSRTEGEERLRDLPV